MHGPAEVAQGGTASGRLRDMKGGDEQLIANTRAAMQRAMLE